MNGRRLIRAGRGLTLLAIACSVTAAPAQAHTGRQPPARHRRSVRGPWVKVTLTPPGQAGGLRAMPQLRFTAAERRPPTIAVDPRIRYQRFIGTGGALTDTSTWLIGTQLAPAARARLLRSLFTRSGAGLNLVRVPIGASDFTADGTPYTYDDMPSGQSDPTLAHFTIAHDLAYTIPVIRQALDLDPDAFTLASLWSPPAWMKTNDALGNNDELGQLKPGAMGPLGAYLVRFLQAYGGHGIHFDALTPQNEPGAPSTYPGANVSVGEQATFVHGYLAPDLRAAGLATQIFGFDAPWQHGWMAEQLLRSPAGPDLSGIATHCYYGSPRAIADLHRLDPLATEIVSECSPGALPFSIPEMEISSLREWASGVALWNIALDPAGGPVQAPNQGCTGCQGIVTIDPRHHSVSFTANYYDLGQVSRFVVPGAVRIASNNFVTYPRPRADTQPLSSPGLDDVAFRNPDGSQVLIAYNGAAQPVRFAVRENRLSFAYRLSPGAMVTFRWA